MEFSEVSNPQFAVPVIGVVVCAILVFAFGFKTPAQPPSFDALLDDDRKSKRNRNRRTGLIHGDKNKNNSSGVSGSDDEDEVSKINLDGARVRSSGAGPVAVSAPQGKWLKSAEEPSEVVQRDDRAGVGGWTTAVSKKDKKNRIRKDENVKQEKSSNLIDSVRPNIPSSRPLKNSKRPSELTTVTVVVPGPPSSNNSVTETSTTYTETAVIKVKVVPSVRVSVSTHQASNGHAIMDRKTASKPSTSTAQPQTFGTARGSKVAPWAKLDSETSKSGCSDKPLLILGFDDWTEVQSSRSPAKKQGNVEENLDKTKITASPDNSEVIYNQIADSSLTSVSNGKSRVDAPTTLKKEPIASSGNPIKDTEAEEIQKISASSPLSQTELNVVVAVELGSHASIDDDKEDSGIAKIDVSELTMECDDVEEHNGLEGSTDDGPHTADWQEAKATKKKRKSRTSVNYGDQ